jgi:hypothetical protein
MSSEDGVSTPQVVRNSNGLELLPSLNKEKL